MDAFSDTGIPDRVRRGLWHHEFAARALDMAARWTSVVTGLEALFNTDPEFVSGQIRGRCAAAAAELGIDLKASDVGKAYSLRSRLSHGAVTSVDAETLNLYCAMERILRSTLKESVRDRGWRARFTDDDTVRGAWPVEMPNECPTCHQPLPERRG